MNSNSKKSGFSRKSIIVVICAIIVLLLVYFIFLRKPEDKVMNCTMSLDNYEYADINMTIDVYYTNKINRLEGEIDFNIIDEELKSKVQEIEERLRKYYTTSLVQDKIDVNVSRMNSKIVIQYNIDYSNVNSDDIETFDFIPVENSSEKLSVSEFKTQIINSGGTCIEG